MPIQVPTAQNNLIKSLMSDKKPKIFILITHDEEKHYTVTIDETE